MKDSERKKIMSDAPQSGQDPKNKQTEDVQDTQVPEKTSGLGHTNTEKKTKQEIQSPRLTARSVESRGSEPSPESSRNTSRTSVGKSLSEEETLNWLGSLSPAEAKSVSEKVYSAYSKKFFRAK